MPGTRDTKRDDSEKKSTDQEKREEVRDCGTLSQSISKSQSSRSSSSSESLISVSSVYFPNPSLESIVLMQAHKGYLGPGSSRLLPEKLGPDIVANRVDSQLLPVAIFNSSEDQIDEEEKDEANQQTC